MVDFLIFLINLKPTYEGLKGCQPRPSSPPLSNLKPTYEGLKVKTLSLGTGTYRKPFKAYL